MRPRTWAAAALALVAAGVIFGIARWPRSPRERDVPAAPPRSEARAVAPALAGDGSVAASALDGAAPPTRGGEQVEGSARTAGDLTDGGADDATAARPRRENVGRASRAGGERARPVARRRPSGTLVVNSEPWAYVWIDGKRQPKTTPLTVKLRPGRHRLRLVNPVVNRGTSLEVLIRSGEVTREAVQF